MSGKYVSRNLRGKKSGGTTTTRPRPAPRPTEDATTAPARKPSPGPRRAPARARRNSAARLRAASLRLTAVAVLALLLGGGVTWFAYRAEAVDKAVAAAQAEAVVGVQAVLAYDYRSFDSAKNNGMAHLTGAYKDDYAKQMDALRVQAEQEKAVLVAPVTSAGVVAVENGSPFSFKPKSVDVLLFVDQTRRNDNITGEKVDQNRVLVTMVPVGDGWKITSLKGL
ncbi:hypothetical protein Afil01_16460 [Actinorhabdospora filicis]|uniref:Mce-associated membrane protein n=1 Tax=Actinorhabdospora filicis TaxID=1785913 RepID=A0A9W6SJN9_9ACTN|nr:hypothetical protein [Actinorhabdospora filicis]GLZ76839.1 hypothetical protein Afil01_16460 [Actinorhabdospora filicis]